MQLKLKRIIITPGEPAGVGPDLVIQLAQLNWPVELVVCADSKLLQDRAKLLKLPLTLLPYKISCQPVPQRAGTLTLLPISLRAPVILGQLKIENSFYVIETLIRAFNGCLNDEFAALVTGPVHKGIINKAGILFTGHTEFFKTILSNKYNQQLVMMLVTDKMRVALATTHIPIKTVPNVITSNLLCEIINILHHDLRVKFGILQPKILVCSLNPHAGEDGFIGNEEISIITPAIKKMKAKKINLSGPVPADTVFQSKYLDNTDVVLVMYHDQGLPVIKYQGFGNCVNITLGLPFIRTSVDHGTALDLVGLGEASVNSFTKALNLAIKLTFNIK